MTPPQRHNSVRHVLEEELWDVVRLREAIPAGPLVVSSETEVELYRTAVAIVDLARRAVMAQGADFGERAKVLGVDADETPLVWSDRNLEDEFSALMARPDIILTENGPKVLELNMSGAFGGPAETHLWTRAWNRIYPGQYQGASPFAARAALFDRVCQVRHLPRSLAVVASTADLAGVETSRTFDVENDYLRQQGFQVRHFEPSDLAEVGAHDVATYPVGLRAFTVADWRRNGSPLDVVTGLVVQHDWLLLPSQTSALVASKNVLALLSESPSWMTETERAFIDRAVPWTRTLRSGTTSVRTRDVDLLPFVRKNRTRLVLKKSSSMMGLDVVLGPQTSQGDWDDIVDRAESSPETWVVQRHVRSVGFPLRLMTPGSPVLSTSVEPVLSPMVIDGARSGIWARYFQDGRSGIVGVDGFGADENVVLVRRDRAGATG